MSLIFKDFVFSQELPFAHPWIPITSPFIYLVGVYLLKVFMQDRPAYTLRAFAVIHSTLLSIASLVMWAGIVVGAKEKIDASGSWSLFCDSAPVQSGTLAFWIYIYWLSKFPELIDTAILILKKKETIFLHVFHHAVMTLMPWMWLKGNWTIVWFGCWMNTGIHVFMYAYFAGSAGWGYVPWWKNVLTMGQISQFILVFVSIWLFFGARLQGYQCQADNGVIWFSMVVNLMFLYLFVKFFFESKGRKKKE